MGNELADQQTKATAHEMLASTDPEEPVMDKREAMAEIKKKSRCATNGSFNYLKNLRFDSRYIWGRRIVMGKETDPVLLLEISFCMVIHS